MKHSKSIFLTSASILVLSLGASSTAQAFDDVDWTWNKEVNSLENITITVDDQFDLSGLVEIEKIQTNIGDVNATSIVSGIENNPPGVSEDGTVFIDETVSVNVLYQDPEGGTTPSVGDDVVYGSNPHQIDVAVLSGQLSESPQTGAHNDLIDLQLTGEIQASAIQGLNDAVDLPSIESAATAVGNNQSISSSVAMNLHDGQYNMGDISFGDNGGGTGALPPIPFEGLDGSNTHTDILELAGLGAALNIIQKGNVSALSDVSNILNASVESSATAVGNNLSVDLQANTVGDAFMVADLTQFNYADVSASSNVTGVSVNNYANLGVLEGPLVSSVATAVGNNVSITVASPSDL